jgi:hypothetical protein
MMNQADGWANRLDVRRQVALVSHRHSDGGVTGSGDPQIVSETGPCSSLLAMFNTPQPEGVAQEVKDSIVKIMTEAASA